MSGNAGEKPIKRKKKKTLWGTFFKIFFTTMIAFIVLAVAAVLGFYYLTGQAPEGVVIKGGVVDPIATIMQPKEPSVNIAVFGTDKDGTHTDVVFVVHVDSENKAVRILSVPRDTRVTLTDEIITEMKADGKYVPSKGVCKFTEVHAYAGKDKRNEYSVKMLEDLLKVDIDYYIKVDLDAFKAIVDAIGGVDFDVPKRLKYTDPYQNLYIDLQPGMQHLDGDKAEQLVRFRKYKLGDVERVQVQQAFIKEFVRKVTNTQTLISNIPELLNIMFKYVDTDFPTVEALKYANLLKNVRADELKTYMMPGHGETVGGVSYFLLHEDEVPDVLNAVFLGVEETTSDSQTTQGETIHGNASKHMSIEVLNGGYTSGLAGKKAEQMKAKGFEVGTIGDYSGTKKKETRIVVGAEGIGSDLLPMFNASPKVVVDESMLNGTDICIILGTDEKE